MDQLLQDVRYGLRALYKRPGFTAVAIAVLALGIGANTAVFSLVNAFLLKPLVINHAEELMGCFSRDTRKADEFRSFSYPNYVDLRDRNVTFSSLMAHNLTMVGVAQGDQTRRAFGDVVSSNYFDTLGVPLYRGRTFTAAEERPGSDSLVTIISYSYWKKNGADPDILGKTLRINGRLFTVVGIAPRDFTGTTALVSPEFYMPLGAYRVAMNEFGGTTASLASRGRNGLLLVGRLKPGVTEKEADAQLAVVASQLEKAYPAENKDQTFIARPLSRLSVSDAPSSDSQMRIPAILLLSMSAVVLLIASLNLANMMLARGTARRREIAIRVAIGGGRGRIIAQLLTEGALLAIAGGAAGMVVASWATKLLMGTLTSVMPFDIAYSSGPDVRVLAITMLFCAFSTVVSGLGPAWKLSRPDVVSDLKKTADEEGAGRGWHVFSRRNLLVVGQLSLSLMMLTAAGLFVRSAVRAANVAPGFAIDHGVIAEIDASLAGYDPTYGRQLSTAVLSRLRRIPGVESADLAFTTPFGYTSYGKSVVPAGDKSGREFDLKWNAVTEGYFQTLSVPVIRGRAFSGAEVQPDAKSHTVVIDKRAAERLWPSEEPVGKHLTLGARPDKPGEDVEVIGVVGNTEDHIIGRVNNGHIYSPFGRDYQANVQVHIKLAQADRVAESRVIDTIRRELRAADEHLPVLSLRTMRDHFEASIDLWIVRTGATMLGIFGAVAMLLAVVGLYGVKAYTVARRTREIGIRMALGASTTNTLNLILREGLAVTLTGIGIGMALAVALAHVLANLLYEVKALDPIVLLGAPIALTAVALAACYLPARRASRVDPMVALRYE